MCVCLYACMYTYMYAYTEERRTQARGWLKAEGEELFFGLRLA